MNLRTTDPSTMLARLQEWPAECGNYPFKRDLERYMKQLDCSDASYDAMLAGRKDHQRDAGVFK